MRPAATPLSSALRTLLPVVNWIWRCAGIVESSWQMFRCNKSVAVLQANNVNYKKYWVCSRQLHLKTSRIISNQHTHKLGQWTRMQSGPAQICRYNAEVYKKRCKTFFIVLFPIPHFVKGEKWLTDKTRLLGKTILRQIFEFLNTGCASDSQK